jgi:hypothetical protein
VEGAGKVAYGRRAYAQSYSPTPGCYVDIDNPTNIICSGDEGSLAGGIDVQGGTGVDTGTYQRIDLDSFTDTTGNTVASESTNSLEGRLGLAVKATAAFDYDMAAAFYTDVNIIHEFLDPATVTIGGDTVTYNTNVTSFEFGGGFNLFSQAGTLGKTFYVDADYRMPIDDPGTTVIEARAGMRFSF